MKERLQQIEKEFNQNSQYIRQLTERNIELRWQYKLLEELIEEKNIAKDIEKDNIKEEEEISK